MKQLMLFVGLIVLIVAVAGAQSVVLPAGQPQGKTRMTRFKVRIENVSAANGQTASDGTRWPFAVSPGFWLVDVKDTTFFTIGEKARANGLEAQAEDGNPEVLAQSLAGHHGGLSSGVFNTPVGADKPGPVGPGGAYEFTVSAQPGMKLSFSMMFGQSNDLFYAPERGIALFDGKGTPISGDVTAQVTLWDAGTEVNQEPGIGPDQAPRQTAPNTGQSESEPVKPVRDGFTYPKTTDVLRITVTPEM
jgi:hypothetical protein